MNRHGWIQRSVSAVVASVVGALVLSVFVLVSCEDLADEEVPATEWYVSLPASDGTASSADWTQADVVKYVVTLTQGGQSVLEQEGKPGARIMLNHLAPGEYDIVVAGYNDVDEVIADGGGTVYLETGKIANVTITLTMRSNDNTYTVSYDANAGSDGVFGDIPAAEKYLYRDEVTVVFPALSRTGYDFDGWNTKADGSGSAYRANGTTLLMVTTHSITLYAQWVPHTYTVAFDAGSSEASGSMAPLACTYDAEQTLPQNAFFRTGYAFVGWAFDATVHGNESQLPPTDYANGAAVKNLTAESGATITLYAKWIARVDTKYTVKHYKQNISDDGYTLFETEYDKVGVALLSTEAEPKSYTGFTPLAFDQKQILSDGSTVVSIYYDRNRYTVTYVASESGVTNIPAQKSYRYESSVKVESAVPVRTGYLFASWQKDTDPTTSFVAGDTVREEITDSILADITMHARWTAITYTIHYSAASTDHVSGAMADTAATYDTGVALRAVGFTRDGYTFAGWSLTEGGAKAHSDGASVLNLSATQGAVVTLYALWTEGTSAYTVEHYHQPATGSTVLAGYELKDSETLGGKTGEATNATANTYTGFTVQSFSQVPIANDGSTVVKIYYNRTPYSVTFDGNGNTGGTTTAQTCYYGVAQALRTNGFVKTGYSFAGWATSATATTSYSDGASYTIGASDVTLYATWAANAYAVTLSAPDATTAGTASVTATYDSAMPALTTLPQRTGYTFAGFYTEANGGGTQYYTAAGESARAWDFAANTTLYAHWTAATNTAYKVEHYQQNTTGDSSTDYTLFATETLYGATGAQTAAAANTYTGFNAPSVTQSTIAADGSTVVKLYYTRKTFTVTYSAGSGITSGVTGIPAAQTYRYGDTVTVASATPVRSGYAFGGWHAGSDTTTVYASGNTVSNAIAENLTLTAVWSAASITITVSNERTTVTATKTNTDTAVTITLQTAGNYTWGIDNASALPGWATVSADTKTLTINKAAWRAAYPNAASGTTVQHQIDAADLSDMTSGKSYHVTLGMTP